MVFEIRNINYIREKLEQTTAVIIDHHDLSKEKESPLIEEPRTTKETETKLESE